MLAADCKSPDPVPKAQTAEELEEEAVHGNYATKGRMPLVFLGRDTRESSLEMTEQIIEGLEMMGV